MYNRCHQKTGARSNFAQFTRSKFTLHRTDVRQHNSVYCISIYKHSLKHGDKPLEHNAK